MSQQTIFKNARIVLEDQIIEGSISVKDGKIASIDEGAASTGEDCDGDYLMPGLVELHTDHLETHYAPRPGLRWNVTAAIQAHDAQIASSGITTVFDCLRMGRGTSDDFEDGEMREMADALASAGTKQRLRAEHYIHLRCEVSSANVVQQFGEFEGLPQVKLASLMDHAPGQRQFQTMDQYTLYYKTKRGLTDAQFETFVKERIAQSEKYSAPNRKTLAKACQERGIAMASHDDATLEHVDESVGFGVHMAEFPTSMEAARASHEAGMSVLMGAPNIVRGGSHSGNIAAVDLAKAGVLDVLSSDYVPFSIMQAPFILADNGICSLPEAIAMVTSTPAKTVGFGDRGRISRGMRADLVRVRHEDGVPMVRSVWREGARVV